MSLVPYDDALALIGWSVIFHYPIFLASVFICFMFVFYFSFFSSASGDGDALALNNVPVCDYL